MWGNLFSFLFMCTTTRVWVLGQWKKEQLPKFQVDQNPVYDIDSLKQEINKNLLAKADSLVDKLLSCPGIMLSNSQTSIMDGVESRVLMPTLLNNCVVKTKTFQNFALLYLTLLVDLQLWFWIEIPKWKREEAGLHPKYQFQRSQRLYIQVGAAFGSVRYLVKGSSLPVSTVRNSLHSKPSYTKYNQAKFKRMKAFANFKNGIWCIKLAYVDRLAKDNNGVMCLLVRQDLFDRSVDAKGRKTKDSKETVHAFLFMIYKKKNRLKKVWVDKGTEFAGEFKIFC